MSNPNKPGGKPGQRNRKPVQELSLKEVQPQSQKPVQLLSQKPAQQPSQKPVQPQSQTPVQQPTQKPEPQLKQQPEQQLKQQETRTQIAAAVASANTLSIDVQAIATAYGDYTKKSFEETKAFVEKLSGVRSLDKAIEIQTEFAKQAYETFVTESQKIRELYSDLAKQTLKPFAGLVANATRAVR